MESKVGGVNAPWARVRAYGLPAIFLVCMVAASLFAAWSAPGAPKHCIEKMLGTTCSHPRHRILRFEDGTLLCSCPDDDDPLPVRRRPQ